jgi:hypothetical protein
MRGREGGIVVNGDLKENSTEMLFEYQLDFSPLSDSSVSKDGKTASEVEERGYIDKK